MVLDVEKVDKENTVRDFFAHLDWVAMQLAVLIGVAMEHPQLLSQEQITLLRVLHQTLWGIANKDPALQFDIRNTPEGNIRVDTAIGVKRHLK